MVSRLPLPCQPLALTQCSIRIIVGVKYCFRYNQRNRALRAAANGEPIDLAVMQRPHRRRREKKLMTMDEVNQRFPLTKYKTWRATREKEGLPTAGGITAAPSRPASVKGVEDDTGPSLRSSSHDEGSSFSHPPPSPTRSVHQPEPIDEVLTEKPNHNVVVSEKMKVPTTPTASVSKEAAGGDEDEEDDPISHAAPPELLAAPGDTCAICLDTLEDDDDVRGLTCGHAFHAACVDPWLTGRRACCPLCKADYYIPKPRPEGEQIQESQLSGGRRSSGMAGLRLNLPQSPQNTWLGGRYMPSRSRMAPLSGGNDVSLEPRRSTSLQNSIAQTQQNERQTSGWRSRFASFGRTRSGNGSGADDQAVERQQESNTSGWRARVLPSRTPFSPFGSRGVNVSSDPSPSQLEEGVVR